MRTALYLFIFSLFCLSPKFAFAKWPWESSYSECVEEHLSQSDRRNLKEIMAMCKEKYPPQVIPFEELKNTEGRGNIENRYLTDYYFSAVFYNGSTSWTIHEVVVMLKNSEKSSKRYTLHATPPIPPLSSGKALVRIFENYENFKWDIIEFKGYQQ